MRETTSPIHQLSVSAAFQQLSQKEKLYAHFMSRAAWHGARIIMRQVSPESTDVYNLIIELYQFCGGNWKDLASERGLDEHSLELWLEYAAKFLSNVGNYYGTGDQKFVPEIEREQLSKLASATNAASEIFSKVASAIYAVPPYSLGFPGRLSQSMYYPGNSEVSQDEIALVSKVLEQHSIYPENTRIRKTQLGRKTQYEVLQASTQTENQKYFELQDQEAIIKVFPGDHARELEEICSCLLEASKYAANDSQKLFLAQYVESFRTGNLETYRSSQRTWVADLQPRVENIFGFVEPYRDPYGVRAEFEGLVAISDIEETKALKTLVENSTKFIKRLPWAVEGGENDGKGPLEKALFEPPDFSSIHALAYCSSIIFPGINLPNYNDIRQDCGFKNVIVANRMSVESNVSEVSPYVDPNEVQTFHEHKFNAYYLWVVLHELVGHGTGKMLREESAGQFNFDIKNPPIDSLTGSSVTSWYKPGQTWTGQFEDLATTVDECRAELVGAYLIDDKELLSLFGFSETSRITANDITYNTYLQIAIDGVRGLQNYSDSTGTWGHAHSRAHFAMLKCMLEDADGFVSIESDPTAESLKVRIDRTKIISHGKPALGSMLLRLHVYRCTADVKACRSYYEKMTRVDGKYLEWRSIVLAQKEPKWLYVQANTFLHDDEVILKEYPPTREGIIQSWAERLV